MGVRRLPAFRREAPPERSCLPLAYSVITEGSRPATARAGELDPVSWNFFNADVLSWRVGLGADEAFRRNLVETRRAVEPQVAALPGERASPADLAELRRCMALMRAKGHTLRLFLPQFAGPRGRAADPDGRRAP